MSKKALCVDKEELLELNNFKDSSGNISMFINPMSILSLEAFLLARPECETQYDSIQLLPYIILMDRESSNVLSYRRGKAGDENRLHNKCSIGFGGHIEDGYSYFSSVQTKIEVLALSALRELNEELGFDLSQYNLHRLRELIGGGNFEVFYSEQNEVSKVHLCILLKLNINVNELKKLEDGVICEPEWLTPEELLAKHKSGERELEGWSEIALDFIN